MNLIEGNAPVKPKAPKKPKLKKPKPPGNVETIIGYAWEHRETGEVEFFNEDRQGGSEWQQSNDDDIVDDFYQTWILLDTTNVELIEEFAEAISVPIKDVFAVPGWGEWCGGFIEYRAIKMLGREEFRQKRKLYDAELELQSDLKKVYEEAVKQYKLDRAEWNLWEAKRKLDKAKDLKKG